MSETLEQLVKRRDPNKLFRARPKRVEDLPEWAKCCPNYTAAALAMGEMIIDLSRTHKGTSYCKWCYAERPELIAATDTGDGTYVHLDELDIDEKPISAELFA